MKYLIVIFCILFINDAAAYLDPGTGSMLLQVVLGGIAAIGVAIKLYWHKVRVFLGAGKKEDREDESI